jgi:predicted alpha/beta-fold hydrolase
MPWLFQDELLDQLGTFPLGYIPYGGADFGEVAAVAKIVGDGDADAFYAAWIGAADRLAARGAEALLAGCRASARDLYLRAACFYGTSYRPLFGEPVDPRLRAAFRKQMAAFEQGLSLLDFPAEALRISFEGATMPGYLLRAQHASRGDVRPLLICTNGYDGTLTDMFFASAVAAMQRGYHCLIFDGPGQGEMLVEQRVRLRPDWENVIAPVVDAALALPGVDPARIALTGWSLGGYLAARAATGESRLAACIADPGLWSMLAPFKTAEVDDRVVERLEAMMVQSPRTRWGVEQRGFWVHGVDSVRDYLQALVPYTLENRAQRIVAPTLLTLAEEDPLGASAPALYDALTCPKKLVTFYATEGAGMHCEQMNRSLLNRVTFDWLDEVFAAS